MDDEMKKHGSNAAEGRSDEWKYACRICGSPYRSSPAICYDCGNETIVSIDLVLADSDRYDP
jgi:rRNA maturation endonuclease Nob1